MANIQIKCLPELACEIPPSSLYSELPIQERLVTVGMNTSGLSVNGPAVVPNSTEATKICRVLAAYHGVVPQSKHTVVVGMHADKNNQDKAAAVFRTARETVQTERYGPNSFIQQFVPGKNMSPIVVGIHPNPVDQTRATSMFRTARETVQTEKYGPKSFIQQYIPGKVCTEDFLVQQTNFSIEARARELQPPNETQAETNTRTADRQAFLDAIASGERLWKTTYESEYRRTVDALPAAKDLESERLARKAEFFKTMKDNPPRCAIDLATLHTRQGCNQAKMIPLGLRNWDLAIEFWSKNTDVDILTSHLEKASNVVDLRKMLKRGNIPNFMNMQGNLWVNACALIYMFIIGPNESKRMEMLLDDRSRRMAAYDLWTDMKPTCLNRIRALYDDLKFHEDERYGTWIQTPVLIPPTKGRKRPAEAGGPGREMVLDRGTY